jgi:hypothetical protein
VLGHCHIKGTRLVRMSSDFHFCGLEPCVIDSHSKHWIAFNSCIQSKLWIKHPKLQTTKNFMSLPEKQLRILVSHITGHYCLNKQQLDEEKAVHFVCVCTTLAILRRHIFGKPIKNASEFAEDFASAILRFSIFFRLISLFTYSGTH